MAYLQDPQTAQEVRRTHLGIDVSNASGVLDPDGNQRFKMGTHGEDSIQMDFAVAEQGVGVPSQRRSKGKPAVRPMAGFRGEPARVPAFPAARLTELYVPGKLQATWDEHHDPVHDEEEGNSTLSVFDVKAAILTNIHGDSV